MSHQQIVFVQGDVRVVLADVDGASVDTDVTIPADAVPGLATIESSVGARAEIEVTARPDTDVLARTGPRPAIVDMAVVGLGILLFGVATLVLTRRVVPHR